MRWWRSTIPPRIATRTSSDDPYRFDVTRRPNHHLAFGVGEHFCAGAHVARLELEMAFKYLLPRLEEVELVGEPDRLRSAI